MRTDFYTCAFTRDPDGGWTAVVLDLPGVVSEGETFAEAQSNISEALELDVEARRARPEAVPTPRPIADLMVIRTWPGSWRVQPWFRLLAPYRRRSLFPSR